MQSSEQFAQFLKEALHALSLPSAVAYQDDPAWQVAFNADQRLDIEYDDAMRRIVISGDLGEIAEEARLKTYEMLLQYNFVWTETGGVRMALDGSTNRVVMMFETAVSELDTSRLSLLLSGMADAHRVWMEILGGPAATGASS